MTEISALSADEVFDLVDSVADAIRDAHDAGPRHWGCCIDEGRFARAAVETTLAQLRERGATR